jgi:hypothetical protein
MDLFPSSSLGTRFSREALLRPTKRSLVKHLLVSKLELGNQGKLKAPCIAAIHEIYRFSEKLVIDDLMTAKR